MHPHILEPSVIDQSAEQSWQSRCVMPWQWQNTISYILSAFFNQLQILSIWIQARSREFREFVYICFAPVPWLRFSSQQFPFSSSIHQQTTTSITFNNSQQTSFTQTKRQQSEHITTVKWSTLQRTCPSHSVKQRLLLTVPATAAEGIMAGSARTILFLSLTGTTRDLLTLVLFVSSTRIV